MPAPDRKTVDDWFRSHGFNIPEETAEPVAPKASTKLWIDTYTGLQQEAGFSRGFTLVGIGLLGLALWVGTFWTIRLLAGWLGTAF